MVCLPLVLECGVPRAEVELFSPKALVVAIVGFDSSESGETIGLDVLCGKNLTVTRFVS